jgi:hypothetical protein
MPLYSQELQESNMTEEFPEITFNEHPDVIIGTNTFRNVPTILQFEGTPLIEVEKSEPAGYRIKYAVYNRDGIQIAVVKGAQMYRTAEGAAANIKLRHEPNLTACELDDKTILELHRHGASALKGWAELYAPEGVLVKANDAGASAMLRNGDFLPLPGGGYLRNSVFDGCKIGILATRQSLTVGVQCKSTFIGQMRF